MKTYKYLEKQTKVWGYPVMDFLGLLMLWVSLNFAVFLIKVFIYPISGLFNLGVTILVILLALYLKFAVGKDHPSFTLSEISFRFLQQKSYPVIQTRIPNGKIKKDRS